MKLSEFEIGDIVESESGIIEYLGETKENDNYKNILPARKGKIIINRNWSKYSAGDIHYDFSPNYSEWKLVQKANKKKESNMFNIFNSNEQIKMNKEIFAQETEKQIGKFILQQIRETEFYKDLPGFIRAFLDKPYGNWIVVNVLIFATNFYSGKFSSELDRFKTCLLRASVSEMGDSYVNSFFDSLISKIKDKFPKKDEE